MFPTIHIHLDPRQITFEPSKGEPFTLKTVVHVAKEKGRWLLAGVGVDTWENRPPEVVAVYLFDHSHALPEEINKLELLQGFMAYGIGKCLGSSILPVLRPTVILHGIDRFRDIFIGFERGIFYNVTEIAGARSVLFD